MLRNLKPIFVCNSVVPRILSYLAPIDINAIAIFPFVFCREGYSEETKNHESIHFQQQLETGVILFYLIYAWDFCRSRIKGFNGPAAYLNIRAEKEAYRNQANPDYLSNRERWGWL